MSKLTPKQEKTKKAVNPLMLDGQSWNRQVVTDIVCDRIATSTRSIATILNEPHEGIALPTYTTFKRWLGEDEKLCAQYAHAKESQADWMAEEMIDIADDSRNDFMEKVNASGEMYVVGDQEMVSRARLRLDTRKWLASKLKPKKYGEKTTIAGDSENPLAVLLMEQITLNPKSRIKLSGE